MRMKLLLPLLALGVVPGETPSATLPDPFASASELSADLGAGRYSAITLTDLYIRRIATIDPQIRSVLAANRDAKSQARAADARRQSGQRLGPLDGLPILVKDNIETLDPIATTAGSLALKDNVTHRDAPAIARLRAASAVILGKTNLSAWANIRDDASISGWSAVGGQTRNPYALDRSPCGSSSGSGSAVAAGLAAAAIGTETNGSITCPAAVAGLVGLKPKVGLVSRTHIVPISVTQDTAGPMTRSVADAAMLLAIMAGSDAADDATREADTRKTDYVRALDAGSLAGARIGVLRSSTGFNAATDAVFATAVELLRSRGAILVEIARFEGMEALDNEHQLPILLTELKSGLADYLATTNPAQVKTRTVDDVIAFNVAHADTELKRFGQALFEQARATTGTADAAYRAHLAESRRIAADGLNSVFAEHTLDALIGPTLAPAWPIDPVLRDRFVGGSLGSIPAMAGYPHLTVPMGAVEGLPVGLSFVGLAWTEARLLSLGSAYEQARGPLARPTFRASVP
ncbi:amidase [soil metagenome]